MLYSDYEYYRDEWHGTMDEASFARMSIRAGGYIDAVTLGRAAALPDGDPRAEHVRKCCCALADLMLEGENGGGVVSEKNDGWELTYASSRQTVIRLDSRLYSTALLWLGRAGLMSVRAGAGVSPC